MSALDIALGYIDRGWKPVPIPYKKKGPVIEGWQTLLLNETTAHDHFNGSAQNIGIILGPPSHGLTDVDLDCPKALTVASYLLPITKAMFGRTSKRASHFCT